MPGAISEPRSFAELAELARVRLDPQTYVYVMGGAGDGAGVAANVGAFARRSLRTRVLTGAAEPDLAVELFGTTFAAPFGVAPMAGQALLHREAERELANGCAAAGVLYCMSCAGTVPSKEIPACGGENWLQVYVYRDRDVTAELVTRAEDDGYRAVVVTVDMPVPGRRFDRLSTQDPTATEHLRMLASLAANHDRTLRWADIGWLRALTALPLVVKGVLTAPDARRALDNGVDAVVVSNHGGRQLRRATAALDALAEVVAEVGADAPVLMDGGVRSGEDVAVALATGADFVLVGRPFALALACGGADGVVALADQFLAELRVAMTMLGAATPRDLRHPGLVRHP